MKKHLLAIALFALCTTGLNAASPKKVTPEKKGVETINRILPLDGIILLFIKISIWRSLLTDNAEVM